MIRSLLALALVLSPSCFISRQTFNEALDPEAVAGLEPGRSTATDAVELLGAPSDVIQLGHRSAWRYDHVVAKRAALFLLVFVAMNEDSHSDRLWLFFDQDGLLTHMGSTLAADLAEYDMPWSGHDHE